MIQDTQSELSKLCPNNNRKLAIRESIKIIHPSSGKKDADNNENNSDNNKIVKHQTTRTISTSKRKRNICKRKEESFNIPWTKKDFNPIIYPFNEEYSGIKKDTSHSFTILDYFQIFFSEEFVACIVEKSNDYRKCKIGNDIRSTSNHFQDIMVNEIFCFFGLTLLTAQVKKLSYTDYWSKDKLLRTHIFGEIMSRDKYLFFMKMLYFSCPKINSNDRLIKIREISEKLRSSFRDSFYPFKNLCIDESLLLFKGRLGFKQYIPSKRNKFGIKSFLLCDCKSGYIQDFIIYTGSDNDVEVNEECVGKSGNVVLTLLQPYLGKGHMLYVDNWYASPKLFTLLHENGINACGTVQKRRKGMPKMEEKLKKGQICFRSTFNLLALKWQDKREVYMLSTGHSAELASTGKIDYRNQEIICKPKCIIDYNSSMGAVDKIDMILSSLHSTRKTLKWYKKYFFHMLDMCVWNAYCIYKINTRKEISMAKFHIELIRQIFQKYHKRNSKFNTGRNSKADYPLRLIERHFPSACNNNVKANKQMRRCVVCSKNNKRRRSRYCCTICNVGLCVEPCFKMYHTQLYY